MTINTVLIEDSPVIRINLTATLQELTSVRIMGWSDSERDAIALLRRVVGWRLAIVDLFLKSGSGFEVIASCAQRNPYQRVVVLTNYSTAEIHTRCLRLGADAVFDKSTDIEALVDFCNAM